MALLRVKRDDSTVKRGLKELAKEVGISPSYLCRVFKKTMGVTVGAYVKEFERGVSGSETESSVQSPSKVGPDEVEAEMEPMTPARSLSLPVEGRKGGPAEVDVRNVEEALDLNFDFDEWFWTEDFTNGNIYG